MLDIHHGHLTGLTTGFEPPRWWRPDFASALFRQVERPCGRVSRCALTTSCRRWQRGDERGGKRWSGPARNEYFHSFSRLLPRGYESSDRGGRSSAVGARRASVRN